MGYRRRFRVVFDRIEYISREAYLVYFDELDYHTHIWLPKSACDIVQLPCPCYMGEMLVENWLITKHVLEDYKYDR